MKNWTKTPQGYSHNTGVTIVKIHPAMTSYAVLIPGAPLEKFGCFAKARTAAKLAAAALEG